MDNDQPSKKSAAGSGGVPLTRREVAASGLALALASALPGCAPTRASAPEPAAEPSIHTLATTLNAAGEHIRFFPLADGGTALVLERGGRLLALAGPDGITRLFSNPALSSAAGGAAFLADTEHWRNLGGDRTWMAPEIQLFIADPARISDTYRVPPELDPGHYAFLATQGASIENSCTIHFPRLALEADVVIGKNWSTTPDPLHATGMSDGLAYAGYAQRTTLAVRTVRGTATRADGTPIVFGLWNLLQLPHDGRLYIPTTTRAEPKVIFGDIPQGDLVVRDRCVEFTMRAPNGQKIALPPGVVTGRCGYVVPLSGDRLSLVVRQFAVAPAAPYADPLWTDPEGPGFCVQACHSSSGDEHFSELEYHAPAIAVRAGENSRDESQVWTYQGPRAAITAAAERLLGIRL